MIAKPEIQPVIIQSKVEEIKHIPEVQEDIKPIQKEEPEEPLS